MSRRGIELLLLCIAAPLVFVLFGMLVASDSAEASPVTLGVPAGIFVAFLLAHLAVRQLAPGADPALLPISFALSGIGIAFVTRLAPELAIRQLLWMCGGIVVMMLVLLAVRNLDKISHYKYTLMLGGIALLLSPLLPVVGTDINGSQIWLSLGPFSFQPGELAKILIVLFLAGYLAENREMLSVFTESVGPFHLPSPQTLLPLLFMWALAFVPVIFEKDLGSALVFYLVFLVMLYVATGKKFYVVVGLALAAVAAVALWVCFDHIQIRVATWLDPFADAQNTGYQLTQTIFSLADGGMFGVGIGNGLAENIPVVESDFIFAAIGEESGLLGAAAVLLLYLCFAIRGIACAARAKSDVSSFTATGLTSIIVLQAFIIVGGVTRLIPLTGITLPFVSQGGSSLLAGFIIVALLLRVGDEGTGVSTEMKSATAALSDNGVLGRVSLGKRLTGTLIVFSALFALLVANLTYIMVVHAEAYQSMPGNNHTMARESKTERGAIETYDGVVLAQSVRSDDDTYVREYPAGELAAHTVGYISEKYGTSGIESSCNDTLKGRENFASWSDVINSMAGVNAPGNDVTLTLNSKIQQAAQEAIAGYRGACVVMDPETGAILALASSPTYDAADVEELIAQAAEQGGESSSSSELYNRATQALYPPGSTFKMVTLATALEDGVADEDTIFDSPGQMDIGNAEVSNFGDYSYGNITLARATHLSSNTVFGQLGVMMGAQRLVEGAERFGFNKQIAFDLPLAMSLMPDPNEMTEWETAWAAAGEPVGEHASPAGPQATVLEMALVGSALGNEGALMQPYLVDSVHNAAGERSYQASPTRWGQVVSGETARRVMEVLKGVVASGTGTAAQISGVEVAGKTGTAEHKGQPDDKWFVGIAPADDAKVVVAVALERVGTSADATTQARGVIEAALKVQGLL